MTTVAIIQSSYLPWKGYFDLIALADVFFFLDSVQYTKNDWRNRNRIKGHNGLVWVTVPVRTARSFGQSISETQVTDGRWAAKHWRTIEQAYARAPCFKNYAEEFAESYSELAKESGLSTINQCFVRLIAKHLQIKTEIRVAIARPEISDPVERILEICRSVGAQTYISGAAAQSYIDANRFADSGIGLSYLKIKKYAPYRQLHGEFEHKVSAIDLLFNEGKSAQRYMLASHNRSDVLTHP